MLNYPGHENIVVVKLPPKPKTSDELEIATQIAKNKPKSDLIIDCQKIGLVDCIALCGFMKLHRILTDSGRRLHFQNMGAAMRGVLSIYGFDRVFSILNDASDAIETITVSNDGQKVTIEGASDYKRPLRRNYARLDVCKTLRLEVLLWHKLAVNDKREVPIDNCSKGILLNISMGGVEIGLPAATQKSEFRENQLLGLEFTPLEKSIVLDGMIKTIRPTADAENICVSVQFAGLEANLEAQQGLQEFCDSTGRYFQTAESVTA